MRRFTLHEGDALATLRGLPADHFHCVVTSPPYLWLRDYGVEGQIGLEDTVEEYLDKIIEIFREVRRVLRPDGTVWLNLGDTYATMGSGSLKGSTLDGSRQVESRKVDRQLRSAEVVRSSTHGKHGYADGRERPARGEVAGLKEKDLIGVPWRVALALQADGWWLRSDIIWAKANPMPESVADRPTRAHEYVFLTKAKRYYYDAVAIQEEAIYGDHPRNGTPDLAPIQAPGQPAQTGLTHLRRAGTKVAGRNSRANVDRDAVHGTWKQDAIAKSTYVGFNDRWDARVAAGTAPTMRNKRSVWTLATEAFPEAHFATFPTELVKPCVLAGTSEHGCCPTCGAPFQRVVEKQFEPQGDVSEEAGLRGAGRQKSYEDAGPNRWDWDGYPRGNTHVTTLGWRPTCTCFAMVAVDAIRAGTSEAGCCRRCGAPFQRVVEKQFEASDAGHSARYEGMATPDLKVAEGDEAADGRQSLPAGVTHVTTMGWQPSCGCAALPTVPCRVLDPFAGAGTTLLVALRLGREATGIELKPEYAALARRRVTGDAPLLNREGSEP